MWSLICTSLTDFKRIKFKYGVDLILLSDLIKFVFVFLLFYLYYVFKWLIRVRINYLFISLFIFYYTSTYLQAHEHKHILAYKCTCTQTYFGMQMHWYSDISLHTDARAHRHILLSDEHKFIELKLAMLNFTEN